jgi:hypothetical protein
MDFRFSEDQLALAETVRDYLSGTHGPEVLRRLDADGNRDPAIWNGLVEMGLTGLLVPEAQGGLGMGLVDAALIAAECGRACVAEPLADTAFVAVPWLLAKGETDQLAAIAAGEVKVPLPHAINPWVADDSHSRHPREGGDPERVAGLSSTVRLHNACALHLLDSRLRGNDGATAPACAGMTVLRLPPARE